MNTKLAKVRQDSTCEMRRDEWYFAADMENVQMLDYGTGWDRTRWAWLCDQRECIGDYNYMMKIMKPWNTWIHYRRAGSAGRGFFWKDWCILKPPFEHVFELNCHENNPKRICMVCLENLLIVHLFPFTVATLRESSSLLLFTDSLHSSTNSSSSIHTIRAVCHSCTPHTAWGGRACAQLLWSCYCETAQNGGHEWSGTIWKCVIWS